MKDIAIRAAKTYAQTFLGLWLAAGVGIDQGGLSVLRMAALGALPAALSVIQNALKTVKA
jgi:hypothetical protein